MLWPLKNQFGEKIIRPFRPDPLRPRDIHSHAGNSGKRGNPEVILVGALAQILAFAQQKNTAASNGSDGRVLMVAGARYQPFRTPVSAFVPILWYIVAGISNGLVSDVRFRAVSRRSKGYSPRFAYRPGSGHVLARYPSTTKM